MKLTYLAPLVAVAGALVACGGGGGGTASNVPPSTASSAQTATMSFTLNIPRKPASSARKPAFFSPGAASMAIYDGTVLVFVADLNLDSQNPFLVDYSADTPTTVAPGSCNFANTVQCTMTLTSTIGQHKFDLVLYSQAQSASGTSTGRKVTAIGTPPPSFHGTISSEGELSVNLDPGTNPAATLTLLGVASQAVFAGTTEAAYQATSTFGYRVDDATNSQIIQPGPAYDNGPVTITADTPGIVTITPAAVATPPAGVATQNFDVTCVNAAGGTVTITIGAGTHPTTTYADGLTYTSSNYSSGTLTSFSFTCDPASGSVPITVQSKRAHR